MANDQLTPKQARFVGLLTTKGTDAYGNATEAYRQSYDVANLTDATVYQQAHALTKNRKIAAILNQAVEQARQAVVFDRVDVMRHLVELAEADPSKVAHIRRICCRHCHGIGFAYQWRDEGEYWARVAEVMDGNARGEQEANRKGITDWQPQPMPTNEGGYGFWRPTKPNPECPRCYGEGKEDMYVADMSTLTGPERRLIASVKKTREGVEVKMRDQDGALTTIAQILKMLVQRSELSGPDGAPIPLAAVTAVLPIDQQQAAQMYQQLIEGRTK